MQEPRAERNGSLNEVKFLLGTGADIRARNDWAVSEAAQASGSGHLDVVRFLVENGADIHAADWYGPDAAVRGAAQASGSGQMDVVRFLLNPHKYGLDMDGCNRNILAQHHPKALAQIQQLEQQELYQNARVMYYTLSFAKQSQYSKGGCGALVQALQESLC